MSFTSCQRTGVPRTVPPYQLAAHCTVPLQGGLHAYTARRLRVTTLAVFFGNFHGDDFHHFLCPVSQPDPRHPRRYLRLPVPEIISRLHASSVRTVLSGPGHPFTHRLAPTSWSSRRRQLRTIWLVLELVTRQVSVHSLPHRPTKKLLLVPPFRR